MFVTYGLLRITARTGSRDIDSGYGGGVFVSKSSEDSTPARRGRTQSSLIQKIISQALSITAARETCLTRAGVCCVGARVTRLLVPGI